MKSEKADKPEKPDVDQCSLCGNDRHDLRKCKCPWHLPFDKWPMELMRVLKERIPKGPSPGS